MGQASEGDHSMLSGKPLGGYRCMACDRPLAALDARPGPHLPTGQLPVSTTSGAELAGGAGAALGKVRGTEFSFRITLYSVTGKVGGRKALPACWPPGL